MTSLLRTIGPRWAFFAAATTLGISAAVAQAVELPEGPGKAVVLASCVDCHEAAKISAVRRSPDEWSTVVARMVEHGAALSVEEQSTVVKYLSANFGAAAGSAAAPAPAASPSQPTQTQTQPPAVRPPEPRDSPAPSAKKPEGAPR